MDILFILHDLSLTGAPKIGLQIAENFAKFSSVTLLARQSGPLSKQINIDVFTDVVIDDSFHESEIEERAQRVKNACKIIKERKPSLIYVNSLASAEWVSAAKQCDVRCVLHSHEMKEGMIALQRNDLFDPYDFEYCDLVVFASKDSQKDYEKLFGRHSNHFNFGVGVDIDKIEGLAKEKIPESFNVNGKKLRRNKKRRRVVMCGTAVPRKGCDHFWNLAKAFPDHDFLWVGSWNDDEFVVGHNYALKLNKKEPLANLYWTNAIDNPYSAIRSADLFVLTSREDPNPLVVLESMALGIPVVAFSGTGSSHILTSKYGYTLSGDVSSERLIKFYERFLMMNNEHLFPIDLKQKLDLNDKAVELYNLITTSINA